MATTHLRRPAEERGHFDHGWLRTWHTFSFGEYHDPEHMGFRSLRVINEDRIAPDSGFPTHGHREMEILTYVISGQIEHRDSLGSRHVVGAGEFQVMSAGTGIRHSEMNPSPTEETHMLQVWILPGQAGADPGYRQRSFGGDGGPLRCLASGTGRADSLAIGADVEVWGGSLDGAGSVEFELRNERALWVQLARGSLTVGAGENTSDLAAGDGFGVSGVRTVRLEAATDAEFLLFDLP